jgi:hypothetical protein
MSAQDFFTGAVVTTCCTTGFGVGDPLESGDIMSAQALLVGACNTMPLCVGSTTILAEGVPTAAGGATVGLLDCARVEAVPASGEATAKGEHREVAVTA